MIVASPVLAAGLASAPIDVSIFRDGEIKRSVEDYGGWTLSCDEVVRLRHRYCSLSAPLRVLGGAPVGTVVVSTGDDGRPAALLRLPNGLALASGVVVTFVSPDGGAGRHNPVNGPLTHAFVSCDAAGCSVLWTLAAREVVALNQGAALQIRFQRVTALPPFSFRVAAAPSAAIDAKADGAGFAAAVAASLRASP
jgi:invasion protein IalB